MKFSKKVITAMLLTLIVFTIAVLILFRIVGEEPSTLITCVFAFCSAEGGFLATIKVVEAKQGNNKSEGDNENDRFDDNP